MDRLYLLVTIAVLAAGGVYLIQENAEQRYEIKLHEQADLWRAERDKDLLKYNEAQNELKRLQDAHKAELRERQIDEENYSPDSRMRFGDDFGKSLSNSMCIISPDNCKDLHSPKSGGATPDSDNTTNDRPRIGGFL